MSGAAQLIEQAHAFAARGDDASAERAFAAVLEREPGHAEAATAASRYALARGEPRAAIAVLERATAASPDHPQLWKNLGVALIAANELDRARDALNRATRLLPSMFGAWLELGRIEERLGDRRAAVHAYLRAVTRAQMQGHWLDEATTPAWLVGDVLHAMEFVRAGRREIFHGLLQPLREQHGAAALARVDRALSGYLRELALASPDPRQRPKFMYFPDLATLPYYPNSRFPWIEALEREHAAIRAEAAAVLAEPAALTPFLELGDANSAQGYLGASGDAPPAWDALFFYRHGERVDAGHTRCPHTSRVLESLPLVRIGAHAPEICFSVLTAGSEILPHHGVTNVRLVAHLPLIVPGDCAIEVGGERHDWREGEVVVFDDTFEHRAWNRSDRTRVILLMDAWHPDLSAVEREAVTALIETIGVVDRG